MDQGTSVGIFQSGGCKRCINADGKSPKSIPAQPFYIIGKIRNSGSSDRLSSIRHGTLLCDDSALVVDLYPSRFSTYD